MHMTLNKIDVCIYAGYTDPFNGENYHNRNIFGSELNIINLSKQLAKRKYIVCVFVWNLILTNEEMYSDGVFYLDAIRLKSINIPINILIINRFAHYFEYFPNVKPKKTIMWVQDCKINYYKDDIMLSPDRGITYCNSKFHKINNVVCLSEWHKRYLESFYNFEKTSLNIIGNAIENDSKNNSIVKNSFIYASHPCRGLTTLIECFKLIQEKIPDCSLTIFRKNDIDKDTLKKISELDNVKLFDKVSNEIVKEQMKCADVFFYPTTFLETYCNVALEAQLYNTVCVYTDAGSLNTTIADRGLKINMSPNDKNFVNFASSEVIKLLENNEMKEFYRKKAHNWATNQTWENRVMEWINIFTA